MPVKKFKQHILEEMTLRILHRLPVKSLIRFSCVSKQWLSTIIRDPEFAKTHYKLAGEQQTLSHRLLVSTQTFGLESIDLETRSFGDNSGVRRLSSPFNEPGHLRFLGSCNGLVFVCQGSYENMSIWNPSTGFLHNLHFPGFLSQGELTFSNHGFGYVSATDDYKVLVACYEREGDEVIGEYLVYSLRGNAWAAIEDPPPYYLKTGYTQGALSNEALHWLDLLDEQHRQRILADEEVGELEEDAELSDLEMMDMDQRYWIHIGVFLGGSLCLWLWTADKMYIEFCVMKEYGVHESWTKLFKYSVADDLGLPDINPLRGLKTVFHTESGTVVAICYDKIELIRIEKLENVVVTSSRYPAGEVLEEVVQYDESLLSLIEYENPTQGGNEERHSTQNNEEGASTKNNEEGA
ncbi:F-box protein CPR30-like [Prunus avium]|uniref:F-box protein CPR30-like n=1 Tax=Prunus avium TaxID=42229 RepID=A0A6P5RA34_PRUAV|nr:F-box protein CPR30-like [Prunus avium]